MAGQITIPKASVVLHESTRPAPHPSDRRNCIRPTREPWPQGMASRWRTEALNKHEDPITLPQQNMGFLSVIPTDYLVELMNSSWKQLSNPWVTQQRLRSPPRFCSSQTAQTDSSQRTGQAGSFCLHTCNMYTKEKGRTWLNITRTRPKITSTSWTYSNSTRNSGLGCVNYLHVKLWVWEISSHAS